MHPQAQAIERVLADVVASLMTKKVSSEEAQKQVNQGLLAEFHRQCPDGKFLINSRIWLLDGVWQITPEVIGSNPEAVAHLEALGYERPYADSTEILSYQSSQQFVDEEGRVWDAAA